MQIQRPSDALNEFGRAVAIEPDSAMAHNNRGVALQALGIRDHAERDFRRALALDPCLAPARENLSKLGQRVDTPCRQ